MEGRRDLIFAVDMQLLFYVTAALHLRLHTDISQQTNLGTGDSEENEDESLNHDNEYVLYIFMYIYDFRYGSILILPDNEVW